MRFHLPARWLALGVFLLSSVLNYLDRQILAALAPLLRDEFSLSHADYGLILTAFSVAYACFSPLAGLILDRFGLTIGISLGVAGWSLAGGATGLVAGLGGFLVCRAALGLFESFGVPAVGKAIHLYLPPAERALGNALSQIGLSLGAILAPPLATWIALNYGWRYAFLLTGALGLLWIPLWISTARRIPPRQPPSSAAVPPPPMAHLLRDLRLWAFVIANIVSMPVYSLWTNWTTLFLKDVHGVSLVQANLMTPVTNLAAYLGGLCGGWLSMVWVRAGLAPLSARMRACRLAATFSLVAALAPFMPGPITSTAVISLSFFAIAAWSVNLYTMPLDTFGAGRAAFSVSLLTAGYGLMQAVVSPAIGAAVDRFGYSPVCIFSALTPLAAYGILLLARPHAHAPQESPQEVAFRTARERS